MNLELGKSRLGCICQSNSPCCSGIRIAVESIQVDMPDSGRHKKDCMTWSTVSRQRCPGIAGMTEDCMQLPGKGLGMLHRHVEGIL